MYCVLGVPLVFQGRKVFETSVLPDYPEMVANSEALLDYEDLIALDDGVILDTIQDLLQTHNQTLLKVTKYIINFST